MRLKQYIALNHLAHTPGVSQRQFGEAMHLDPNNTVLMLNDLEAAGWAERRRDPEDRRRHVVEITPPAARRSRAPTRARRPRGRRPRRPERRRAHDAARSARPRDGGRPPRPSRPRSPALRARAVALGAPGDLQVAQVAERLGQPPVRVHRRHRARRSTRGTASKAVTGPSLAQHALQRAQPLARRARGWPRCGPARR